MDKRQAASAALQALESLKAQTQESNLWQMGLLSYQGQALEAIFRGISNGTRQTGGEALEKHLEAVVSAVDNHLPSEADKEQLERLISLVYEHGLDFPPMERKVHSRER